MSIDRRGLLKSIGLLSVGGAGYAAYDSGLVSALSPDTVSAPLPGGFKSVEWVGESVELTLEDSHKMDGVALMHRSKDDVVDHAVNVWAAPEFGGPKRLDVVNQIRQSASKFPDRQFKLIAVRGAIGYMSVIEDQGPSIGITVPEDVMPAKSLRS